MFGRARQKKTLNWLKSLNGKVDELSKAQAHNLETIKAETQSLETIRGALAQQQSVLHKLTADPPKIEMPHRSHYLGDHTSLTYTHFGRKIYVDTRDVSIAPHLMTDGRWEPWVDNFITQQLSPGMVFFDIGANCGYFSLLAAHMVGPQGHVVAFEPQARLAGLLTRSASVNGFPGYLTVVNKGLSNTASSLRLYKYEGLMGSASFNARTDEFDEVEVANGADEIMRLEDMLGRGLTPDFLKIDVEGFEPFVWEGLRPILDRCQSCVIVLEFTPGAYTNWSSGAAGFLDMIEDSQFALHLLKHDGSVSPVSKADLLDGSITEFVDLVLVKGRTLGHA